MKKMGSEIIAIRALDINVLVVAVWRVEGAWCAYIKNVPGFSHELEAEEVRKNGSKLAPKIAKAIFPGIDGPYAY